LYHSPARLTILLVSCVPVGRLMERRTVIPPLARRRGAALVDCKKNALRDEKEVDIAVPCTDSSC
jgi:hypothetical protein